MSRDTVVLQFATQLEAKPFIEALRLTPLQQKPFSLYGGDSSLYVIIGGIGINPASVTATYSILSLNANIIINIGAAGALQKSQILGTTYSVTEVIDTTRYNLSSMVSYTYTISPVSEFVKARCVSVVQPLRTKEERNAFANIADIVDMELAGIAYASQKFGINCYALKYITDTQEHSSQYQIVKNITTISPQVIPIILKGINYLISNYISNI